jgi:thiol:disulfide interchange protein DsbD
MKRLAYVWIAFLVLTTVNAQIKQPVKWKSKVEKLSENEFNLILNGSIEDEWHVYSQFTPEDGPLPMVVTFKDVNGNFELVGKAKESPYKKQFNDVFGVDEYYFEHNFTITQKVKITNPKTSKIKLYLEYQVCKEACINESNDFVFEIPSKSSVVIPVEDTTPTKDTLAFTTEASITSVQTTVQQAVPVLAESTNDKKSLLAIFLIAFFSGFAALLMPCIFPMIPMTVSFFTKQSKSKAAGVKNAVIYGLSIIAIYVILGSLITAIFGAEALNELSTSVWFNIIFFALLVVFGLSFLGAFEIMLPSSWATKIDAKADKGGLIGIFFMALALAVVSFSCTGPIVGTLLVESASKGGIAPIVGMLGFSLAIALPFMLFAMFPGWLNSLPKSGGWLNTVKVSLGFLELAFAFKFLSNADLVLQKHWLERELFIAIWIAIFGAWALYLFGKFMLPHDYQKADRIGVGRLMMAIVVTTFTFYMIPGLWGAPLKILSGLTPPINYAESTTGFGLSTTNKTELPEHAHFGPHGIVAFEEYDYGLAYAKKVNKPVLLDFTGDACANCRKMEDNVWSDPAILKILKEDVVLISLYCDRKIDLPKDKQYISKTTGKKVVTIGNRWTDFQITRYKSNSQPLYVTDGKDLSKPIAFTFEKQDYKKWLEDGISKFKK